MLKIGIKHSALHRFARENGLKKTKQFQRKCQLATAEAARLANKRNNWPPKGYVIPNRNSFEKGITPEQRLGKEKNAERIRLSAESRRVTVKAEKRRVLFGLPQKTKLKVVSAPRAKLAYKYTLKVRGYITERGSSEIYFDQNTNRSDIVEKTATLRYRFRIKEFYQISNN